MTAYVATLNSTGNIALGVKPGTAQTRIAKIEISATYTGSGGTFTVLTYSGASFSGGSTVTPKAMRDGAQPAVATVKSGATISGTSYVLHQELYTGTSTSTNTNASYAPAFDLILSSSSALWVTVNAASTTLIVIYFEELHLARSV